MPEPELTPVDAAIDAAIRAEPPSSGATLNGWVALAEWSRPNGEPMLVLMGRPAAGLLQLKSYLHSGLLKMVWKEYGDPDNAERTP